MLIHSGELLETGGSNMVANLLVCLLVAYSSMMITKLIMDFDSENVNTIRSSAEENEGSRRTGSAIAENIIANFETAMNVMDELTESILKNRTSMSNIAESTESTAAAIQQQAVMCKDVQDQASNGGALAEDMMGASKEVESTVSEGLTMVRELGEQAENVVAVSNNTVDVVNELTTKVQDVEKFIGTIVNISRQTNLLALNASIEAAGAGEAGKGFAVVAEEIRKLSEETRDASDNITRIITELNNDTERANASLGEAVESVKKQNELIGGTGEKFNKVDIQIQSLITNIGHVRDLIAAAIGATSTVAEKVEVLSASSEEVAAESSEGFAASNRAVDEVEECKNVLKKIKQQADELHANLSVAGR
jgi:methyl-accepting chemotaxis protein